LSDTADLSFILLYVYSLGAEITQSVYTMATGSFLGVKRPGRGVDHPPPSSAKVKERLELCLYSPSGPSWPFLFKWCRAIHSL